MGLLVGILSFALQDRLIPLTATRLIDWGVGEYRANDRLNQVEDLWVRGPNIVARIPVEGMRRGMLENIAIFERDDDGRLLARIDAKRARPTEDGLGLTGVTVRRLPGNEISHHAELDWKGRLPNDLSLASAHPSELTTLRLARISQADIQGLWPSHYYMTWLQKRLAAIFVPVVLIGIGVALSQRLRPRQGMATFLVIGMGCGFAYFLFSGWVTALGELGFLPPVLAAWAPVAILASVAGSFAVFREGRMRQAKVRAL